MFLVMGLVLTVLLAENFDEIFHFFTDHLFVNVVTHIFEAHEECKFADVALQPNIVNLLGEMFLVSVQIPLIESFLEV